MCDADLASGTGDTTELAILAEAALRGIQREDIERDRPRVDVTPFDSERKRMSIRRADGTIFADARAPIEEFEEMVGPILTDEEREQDINTLGGLVMSLTDRVPSRGELVTHPSGFAFEVLDADPRRIKRLRVRPKLVPADEPAKQD